MPAKRLTCQPGQENNSESLSSCGHFAILIIEIGQELWPWRLLKVQKRTRGLWIQSGYKLDFLTLKTGKMGKNKKLSKLAQIW